MQDARTSFFLCPSWLSWFYLVRFLLILAGSLLACLLSLRASGVEPEIAPATITRLEVLEDSAARWRIEDVIQADWQKRFRELEPDALNLGYTSAPYWVKLTIKPGTRPGEQFLIAEQPMVQFEAYLDGTDGSGFALQAQATHPVPAARLSFPDQREVTLYLRVWSRYVLDLQFSLLDATHLAQRHQNELSFSGIITGVFMALILYNAFLFISLRDRTYLHYITFGLVNAHLNLLAINFPQGIWNWFGIDWWAFLAFYRPLAPLTAILFARSFLKSTPWHPRMDQLFMVYMLGLVGLMLASFVVEQAVLFGYQDAYFFLGIMLLLVAGTKAMLGGYRPARLYLAGLVAFVLGMFIYLGKSLGIFPSHVVTVHAHLLGHALEMLLMSLALGGKIKILQDQKTFAEAETVLKSRLIRTISHDVASPLTVIKVTAQSLERLPNLQSKMQRVLRAISIIESILQFVLKKESLSHSEAMQLEAVALKPIFEELRFLYHDQALAKGITLNWDLKDEHLYALAERNSLTHEVLSNLLSNAIKFSFPGSKVRVEASPQPNRRIQIKVQDQGLGMKPSQLEKLFQFELKQTRQGTQGERGNGFGLSLAQAYVQAYGGRLDVQSIAAEDNPRDCGTTFLVTLASPEGQMS